MLHEQLSLCKRNKLELLLKKLILQLSLQINITINITIIFTNYFQMVTFTEKTNSNCIMNIINRSKKCFTTEIDDNKYHNETNTFP